MINKLFLLRFNNVTCKFTCIFKISAYFFSKKSKKIYNVNKIKKKK